MTAVGGTHETVSTAAATSSAVLVDGEAVKCTARTSSPGEPAAEIYIEMDFVDGAVTSDAITPRRALRDHASSTLTAAGYTSLGGVLCSKFVLSQLAFNMIGSFCGPLLSFWLIFGVLSTGPYMWNDSAVLGPIFGSAFVSATLCPLLAPVGLPEAVAWGWGYSKVRQIEADRWSCVLPPLGRHPVWRRGIVRHLALGLQVGVVVWPVAILLARYALGPELSTWTQIVGGAVYCVLLSIPCTMCSARVAGS